MTNKELENIGFYHVMGQPEQVLCYVISKEYAIETTPESFNCGNHRSWDLYNIKHSHVPQIIFPTPRNMDEVILLIKRLEDEYTQKRGY